MIRVFDSHADTPYELWVRKEHILDSSCHIDVRKAKEFAHYEQVFAFCSLAGSKWEISKEEFLACYRYFLEELKTQDVIHAHFSIEGAEAIDCDPEQIAALSREGFVMSTLTWNSDNALAGWHKSDKGLTDRGIAYVHSAQENSVLIDVSHLSEKGFWDLVKVTRGPIVASHSNCRAIWDHSRNLTDDQLRAIAETDGVVGLNLYAAFLGEDPDFDTLRRHLDHIIEVCGPRHICLGGDLDGCEELPKGFRNVSDYCSLYQYLRQHGYDRPLLEQLFDSNLRRLIKGAS